jgi:hypothetical protein
MPRWRADIIDEHVHFGTVEADNERATPRQGASSRIWRASGSISRSVPRTAVVDHSGRGSNCPHLRGSYTLPAGESPEMIQRHLAEAEEAVAKGAGADLVAEQQRPCRGGVNSSKSSGGPQTRAPELRPGLSLELNWPSSRRSSQS